jgi:hypothetical protein
MAEVRDELERAFTEVLQALPLLAAYPLKVVPGSSPEDQEDEFLRVTCVDAEHAAGGVYRVDMEITVVLEIAKMDAGTYEGRWFGGICRYFDSKTCPLRTYRDSGLAVFGYRVMGQEERRGGRQFAQTLRLKVGAAALGS